MMKNICLAVGMLLVASLSFGQQIKGHIVDSATGKPVANANIYLNGTQQGTASDANGNFIIKTKESTIPLIISCVGYLSMNVDHYAGNEVTVSMKRKPNILKEVTVGERHRDVYMTLFLREFMGTRNHLYSISNASAIKFSYHSKDNILEATANEPLIIYNRKLGYKITYFLTQFQYWAGRGASITGNYFFTEDTAGLHPDTIRKILKVRDFMYYGSKMHFIRTLLADRLTQEGYIIRNRNDAQLTRNDLVTTDENGQPAMRIKERVQIDYKADITTLFVLDTTKLATVGGNGYYSRVLTWQGEMGVQRVGELLPFEFQPQAEHTTPLIVKK